MIEVDSIELIPDGIGWTLRLNLPNEDGWHRAHEYALGDCIQFQQETERTIGRWLADGPADFHNAPDPTEIADQEEREYRAYLRQKERFD